MKMATFEEVTKKFWRTEEERLRKTSENKNLIMEFSLQTSELRRELEKRKILIWVFEFDEPKIHAGLHRCCGDDSGLPITEDDRKFVASQIIELTRFKEVFWEL